MTAIEWFWTIGSIASIVTFLEAQGLAVTLIVKRILRHIHKKVNGK
jgi:small-conductance mechanosensitive channel